MIEKRFTTVELPKPNKWGIWYDGAYLSTYQVCILLNEYVDVQKENDQLKKELFETRKELLWATSDEVDRVLYYEDEVEELRKEIFND